MKLFIRIIDGKPFEHPILQENFCQAFPEVDIENLPINFAEFIRVETPFIDKFQVYEGVTYEKDEDAYIWRDVHHVREMNEEEKQTYITNLKNQEMPLGWVFDDKNFVWINTNN